MPDAREPTQPVPPVMVDPVVRKTDMALGTSILVVLVLASPVLYCFLKLVWG
ncbi:MAG TPA: hypothetical protein VIY48_13295 [Candidatus Paceibacterota bacterium]